MQQADRTGSIVVRFFIGHDGSDPVQLSWMAAEQKQHGDMIISGEPLLHPSPFLLPLRDAPTMSGRHEQTACFREEYRVSFLSLLVAC